jgi:hypothetical protein
MDPVSALNVAGVGCQLAGQMVSLCDTLYDYFRKVKHAPKLSREVRQEALLLSDVLENLRVLLPADVSVPSHRIVTTTVFMDTMDEFTETINEMSHRLEIKDKLFSMKRLQWPFEQSENERYFKKLERFKNTFQLALQAIQTYSPKLICY